MDDQSKNLRYLLWKRNHPKAQWTRTLASWLGCSELRAKELLNGGKLSAFEQNAIAKFTEISEEDLVYTDLLEKDKSTIKIWQENLLYLLNENLDYKENGELAKSLGIGNDVISNWKSRKHSPAKKHKEKVQIFFKIDSHTDLEKDPIFLSFSPISIREKRKWLLDCIKNIDDRELDRLFHALEKLLAEE